MVVVLVALGALAGVAPAVLASASPPLVAVLGLGGVAAVLMSGELDRSARARRGFGPRWYSLARNLAMLLLVAITVASVAGITIPAPPLVTTWLFTPLLYLAGAGIAQQFLGMSRTRTIIIGSGDVAHTAIETTRRHPELGIDIVGIVDDPSPNGEFEGFARGSLAELPELVARLDAQSVLVGFSTRRDHELVATLRACDELGVEVAVVPRLFDLIGPRPSELALGALGTVAFRRQPPGRIEKAVKRGFDLAVVAVLAVPAVVAVTIAALAVKLSSPGPVFFSQERIGLRGRRFNILKLRTMVTDAEARVAEEVARMRDEGASGGEIATAIKQVDDPRVTQIGRVLRRTSLDELPQLWNVLVGEMSIVGPRPLPLREGERLDSWELARLDMRPGITGLWQVVGRSALPWEERMQLDYLYVRNWSLATDLSIIARTLGTVSRADGAT